MWRRHKLSLWTNNSIEKTTTTTAITITTAVTPCTTATNRNHVALYAIRKDVTYGNILRRSKTKFKNKFKDCFQEQIKQYIIDYKGDDNEDNDKDNEITNAFNTLVIDIDPDTLLNKDDQATVYYTLYGEIELDNVTATALELANRACSYAVIIINTTTNIFPTDTDLFVYNTILCYTSTKFMGVMIDTGASKHSTVGYGQFLAF